MCILITVGTFLCPPGLLHHLWSVLFYLLSWEGLRWRVPRQEAQLIFFPGCELKYPSGGTRAGTPLMNMTTFIVLHFLFSTPPSLFKPPTWNVLLTKQDVKLLRRVLAQPGSFKVSENHFSLQIVSLHLVWHDVQMFAHIQSCQPIRMDLTSFVDKSSMHILDQKKSNLNVENV